MTGVLTAGGAAGQLVFLPLLACWYATTAGVRRRWCVAGGGAGGRTLVLWLLRDHPADLGLPAYGATEVVAAAAGRPAARAARAARRAARRRPDPAVLAAGRRLRDLRRDHQRPGRHPLHPGRARPRHAADHRGRPARPGRALRHRRHHRLRLAHRPGGHPAAARRLLRAARAVAAGAAERCSPAPPHPSMLVFIIFYGLDWVATVPPTVALCREYFGAAGSGRVRLGVRRAPVRGGGRRDRCGPGPRPARRLRDRPGTRPGRCRSARPGCRAAAPTTGRCRRPCWSPRPRPGAWSFRG